MHENRETSAASRPEQDRGRLAKAQSHNANMHAPEGSDCAVVPMNQPNQEEQSSAEVGEGRARAKENIAQSNTSPELARPSRAATVKRRLSCRRLRPTCGHLVHWVVQQDTPLIVLVVDCCAGALQRKPGRASSVTLRPAALS
jgi:hypothetical protein